MSAPPLAAATLASAAARLAGRLREELPAFAASAPEALERAALADLRDAIAALCANRPQRAAGVGGRLCALASGELDPATLVRVHLLAAEELSRRLSAEGRRELTERLWRDCATALPEAAAASRARVRLLAPAELSERALAVRQLVGGELGTAELERLAFAHDLRFERRYAVACAPALAGAELRALLAALAAGRRGGPLLSARIGERIVAIVPAPVSSGARELPHPVGVGLPTRLRRLRSSFAQACRALDAARAFGETGIVTLDGLGLRAAVLDEPEVGERLARRLAAGLAPAGRFGAVLRQSAAAFLRADGVVADASAQLHVHPNTLRHRLQRFEQLTGWQLTRVEDLAEVWWALEHRRAAAGAPGLG